MNNTKRLNKDKILLGTYCFANYCWDDEHVKQLADAGIDFVAAASASPVLLDLFEKYGIGAFVSSGSVLPFWRGGDRPMNSEKHPQPTFTLESYREAANKVTDHPAIWGFELVDEPYTMDFDFYEGERAILDEIFDKHTTYINLFPSYANSDQLGSETFAEHIKEYVKRINTDYICYDHYIYGQGDAQLPKFFENLDAVADACRKSGRDHWAVIQVNSNQPEIFLSSDKLKLQVYLALAYGAKSINYACWTAGWWHNFPIDSNGNKTEQYDKVKEVNSDINALSPVYMQFVQKADCIIGITDGKAFNDYINSMDTDLGQNNFIGLETAEDSSVAVGYFEKTGGSALMLVNITDPDFKRDVSTWVKFRTTKPDAVVTAYVKGIPTVLKTVNGVYTVQMNNADGVFVVLE